MPIVCPHCRTPQGDSQPDAAGEILCSTCGSGFRVSEETTRDWRPEDETRHIGKFELLARIGSGGFGIVYKARDPELERVVAVKVPRAGEFADPIEMDRFVREGRSVAQLRHPNIVPIFEVGQSGSLPFLVSEFVHGVTLTDWLSAKRPDAEASARMIAALADALHYAHTQGVVHRDVKPANILLEADGTPRLADFGLAKRDAGESTLTADGQVVGTPAYMSPEQARGDAHIDGRTDVYSLGVVLYQLLTGQLPFRGTARMLLHQVLHDEAPSVRRVQSSVPRDMETICMKALAKEPAQRYASAAALADDLRRFLAGQPILARPPGVVERVQRGLRRFRRECLFSLGGAAVAIIAVVWIADPFRTPPGVDPGPKVLPPPGQVKEPELPADLALIPPEAIGFVCVEAARLRNDLAAKETLKQFGKELGEILALDNDVERVVLFVVRDDKSGAVSDSVLIITTSAPVIQERLMDAVGPDRIQKKTGKGLTYFVQTPKASDAPKAPGSQLAACSITERMYILGPEQVILKVVDRASDAANPWRRPLLQAPRRAHVLTGLYPPEVIRQMMADEFLRQHPSLKPWSQCQTALMALSIEPDGEIAVDLMCEFSPQVQPKETQERTVKRTLELLEEQVGQLRKGLGAKDPTGQLMEKMEAGMAQALVQSRSANVVASIRVKTDANTLGAGLELLRPATQGAQLVAGRTLCANNLKQIGLALHVFADDHGRLPAHAIFSKDGTPLLSWRVALLPTLDMHDLYAQFKLDEPWDSAHNLKLLDRMPAIYAAVPHKSATHFQAFVGKGAVFDGMTGIRWQDIADGNSQTAMIVEAFEPVPWTKPADIDFDAKRPLPKFGKVSPLGFHLLMADASVRFIREVDPDTMRDLILRNDGRVIDVRKIRD